MTVKRGDTVMYEKQGTNEIEIGSEKLLLFNDIN